MKLVKQTNDTLIIHGYGWLRFAAALLFMLATPLWVWVAYHFPLVGPFGTAPGSEGVRRFGLIVMAALAPMVIFTLVTKTYRNWQLILEASYDRGALHIGDWGTRQNTTSFALHDLEKAERKTRTIKVRSEGWNKTEEVHSLMLVFSNGRHPLHICDANSGEIDRIAWIITDWAKRVSPAVPLDSTAVQS